MSENILINNKINKKINKKKITLAVSEVSTLIGVNQYGCLKSIILKLWKKSSPVSYFNRIDELVKANQIENPLIRDEEVISHQKYSNKSNRSKSISSKSIQNKELNQESDT
jgi:hypothetical protein